MHDPSGAVGLAFAVPVLPSMARLPQGLLRLPQLGLLPQRPLPNIPMHLIHHLHRDILAEVTPEAGHVVQQRVRAIGGGLVFAPLGAHGVADGGEGGADEGFGSGDEEG